MHHRTFQLEGAGMLMYKPDWEETKQRFLAWWEGEVIDRCAIAVYAPKDGLPPAEPPAFPEQVEDRWTDFDYLHAVNDYRLSRTFFGGEALPIWHPGYPGTSSHWVFLGCSLELAEDTGWTEPILNDGALTDHRYTDLVLDPDNRWFKFSQQVLRVAAEEARGKSLSVDEQATALSARGDAFAVLGCYDESIPLREASLLCNPDLTKTRVAALDEYYRRAHANIEGNRHTLEKKHDRDRDTYSSMVNDPAFAATLADAVSGYERSLEHADYLIRKRQQSPCDVYGILNAIEWYTMALQGSFWGGKLSPEDATGVKPLVDRAEKARQRFVRGVTTMLLHNIDPKDAPQVSMATGCHNLVMHIASLSLAGLGADTNTLSRLRFQREIAEMIPDDFLPSPLPNRYIQNMNPFNGEVTEPVYLAFIRDIQRSPHRLMQLDASFILLSQRLAQASAAGNYDALLGIQSEFKQLIDKLNAIPNPYPPMTPGPVSITPTFGMPLRRHWRNTSRPRRKTRRAPCISSPIISRWWREKQPRKRCLRNSPGRR